MERETFAIPGAAERAELLRYQAACVDKVRMLLCIRGARRVRQPIPNEPEKRLGTLTDELTEIARGYSVPFSKTCDALALEPFLRDALEIVVAPHFDHEIREAIAQFWGQPGRRHVDAALIVELLAEETWQKVSLARRLRDGSPLHVAGLIESAPAPTGHAPSPLEHELVPTMRLLRLFDAEIGLDPRFESFARVMHADADAAIGVVTPERMREVALLVGAAHQSTSDGGCVVMLAGPNGAGKLRLARTLCTILRTRHLLVAEASQLPTDPFRLTKTIRSLGHEAELLAARLVLRRVDAFATDQRLAANLRHALANSTFRTWVTSDVDPARIDAPNLVGMAPLTVSVSLPDLAMRREAWRAELSRLRYEATDSDLELLASDYPLSRSSIERAASMASALTSPDAQVMTLLPRVAETQMLGQLGRFAKRSRSVARVRDVVLSDSTREQVNELLAALERRRGVMSRWGLAERHATGRGIVSLFNGPPGTGKTLTAAAIANELDIPLYRIDASAVVDRYVGETEKNLVRLFDEAAASRAALLFDEADSLFGKRVEARDATDRYANMQINLLLNLIEDYDGFVVLTTNLRGALDDAFLRRIVYKIVFDKPEQEQLLALWEYHLPGTINRADDVDLQALAEEFDQLTGGDIKNAVLRATLAAADEEPITQQMLRRAVINELRANGSVIAG